MEINRRHLSILFNRLYDRGDDTIALSHPADEIGTVLEIDLGTYDASTVRFTMDLESYANARNDVGRNYGDRVMNDLPESADLRNAVMASGIVDPANIDDIEAFLDRYGDPDLMAGHPPVVAGFDTNLMPWRIDRILGLHDPDAGIGYVTGFALATGVRDELEWDDKCHDTDPFEDAFGDAFTEYWNQPLGAVRIGRLGIENYRRIRDIEQAVEVESDRGDEAIIDAYDEYDREDRSDVILFSNDRNFVERARSHTLLGQHVAFPSTFPAKATASWDEIEELVYTLGIIFGVVELPSVTIHGVWRGKEGLDWQHDRLKLDVRSPPLEGHLEGDLSITDSFEELSER